MPALALFLATPSTSAAVGITFSSVEIDANASGDVFCDGFESGTAARWSASP